MHMPRNLWRGAVVLVLLAIAVQGCSRMPRVEPADLVLLNGRVYSLAWPDPAPDGTPAAGAPVDAGGWRPDAAAVAVRDGAIVFVGTSEAALVYRGPDTEAIDVEGATILPGLVDSHTHVVNLGAALNEVDLVGVETEAEAVARVAAAASERPAGTWIVGRGWDEGAWADRYPDMAMLSARVPDHPVALRSLHSFAIWGNRLAFERAGITADTPAPEGGNIRTDERGQPTGILLNRAVALLEDAIPPPDEAQLKKQISDALTAMTSAGYVMVHEAGVDGPTLQALEALEAEAALPLRVYIMLSARDTALLDAWRARGPKTDKGSKLTVRAVKAFYDGALGSRGARLLEDYADLEGHRGVSGESYGFDRERMRQMMEAGFQAAIHAIGDAANRETLDFFARVQADAPETRGGRHRIEHAQVLHPADVPRFAELDVIASMEPGHAVEDKAWAEERLGPERIAGAYAWRSLRCAGARLIFNSDLPGSDHDIFYGLHSATTRQDRDGEPPGGWYPEQRMTPEEAVRGYTSWAAYSAFLEHDTGALEPGRWADITVVDVDPFRANPADLLKGSVRLTVVGGEVVYRAPDPGDRRD